MPGPGDDDTAPSTPEALLAPDPAELSPTPGLPPTEPPPGLWREIVEQWGPAILAVILIRLFVFEPFRIPSGSMVPTLLVGDFVAVTKSSYGLWMPWKSIGVPGTDWYIDLDNVELWDWGDPERGDIIVFHYPRDEAVTFIKRVVAIPGDTLRVINNQVILNGERLPHTVMGPFEDVNARCATREARRWSTELPRTHGDPLRYSTLTGVQYTGSLANHREITVPEGHVFVMGDNRDHSEDSRAWGFVSEDLIKGKAHVIWMSWNGCSDMDDTVRLDRMPRSLYNADDLPDPSP